MAFKVHIESFEGPFDLLLQLIAAHKLEVTSLSLSEVVEQYLEEISRLEQADLEVQSNFMLVASQLLQLKASGLLYGKAGQNEDLFSADDEAFEGGLELVEQLFRYKALRDASFALEDRSLEQQKYHARYFGPDTQFLSAAPDYLEGTSLEDLARSAMYMLSKTEVYLLESPHISAKALPIEKQLRSIVLRLKESGRIKFSDLLEEDSSNAFVVVNFLAVLELYKRSVIDIRQRELFSDMELRYKGDAEGHTASKAVRAR